MMRTDIEFNADNTTLRGWLYTPDANVKSLPTVVMAPGFAMVKEQALDKLAEVFVSAGLVCVVYDNRSTGASDGEPRGDIDPYAQMHDYRHAITYAQALPQVDSERVGIWGTSYSGAHVLAVAAVDRRVKCVVAQVPATSGIRTDQQLMTPYALTGLRKQLDDERGRKTARQATCNNQDGFKRPKHALRLSWRTFVQRLHCVRRSSSKLAQRMYSAIA